MERLAAHGPRLVGWLPWATIVASIGALVELTGGGWDILWHLAQRPETFCTPPHTMLYAGASVLFAFAGYLLLLRALGVYLPAPVARTVAVVMVGAALQMGAGALDQWWHAAYGVDDALSPPHVLLTGGMVVASSGLVLTLGLLRATAAPRTSPSPGVLLTAQVVALAALWFSIWGFAFILTSPGLGPLESRFREAAALGIHEPEARIAYVYDHPLLQGLPERLAVALLFAAIEPFVLVIARGIVGSAHAATAVAALGTGVSVFIAVLMAVVAGAAFAPPWAYLLAVAPGVAVDAAWRASPGGRRRLALLAATVASAEMAFGLLPRGVLISTGWPNADPLAFGAAFLLGGLGAWVLSMLIGGELLLALGSTKKVAQPRSGA